VEGGEEAGNRDFGSARKRKKGELEEEEGGGEKKVKKGVQGRTSESRGGKQRNGERKGKESRKRSE